VVFLIIHVVKLGDNIYGIAKQYGVTPESIISTNQLENPSQLVVGQTVVIPQGQRVYAVKAGDTLSSIARQFGASSAALAGENPEIGTGARIYPGQILVIPSSSEKSQKIIEVNGYMFPGSKMPVVEQSLPSLTYLSIFSYEANADGSLNTIDDTKWITLARNNHVAPVMVITNIRQSGGFSSDIAHSVLTNEQAQNTLINNVANIMHSKNYYALNIDLEYIFPYDRQSYNNFLRKITTHMHSMGYPVFTAVAPKLTAGQKGLLYEAHDYPAHGSIVDRVIIMTYEWGYLAGPPQAVAPLNQVKKVVDYAITVIPPSKILLGVPNYGYDWVLPYTKGTLATTFSNIDAVARAFKNKADIKFDTAAQSPYYNYYDTQHREHIVWFEDARSIQQKLRLVQQYNLAGISYWTSERPFPQNYIVLNDMYNIKKVI
jgi:spore germination protein